jgi:hypothetical protein
MTPVVCATSVVCPTLVVYPYSGRTFLTLVDVTTSVVSSDSGHVEWLQSMSVPHVLSPQLRKTSHD